MERKTLNPDRDRIPVFYHATSILLTEKLWFMECNLLLTPRRVILQKEQSVVHLIKKKSPSVEADGSLMCLEQLAI
jgi:hypothetical protein